MLTWSIRRTVTTTVLVLAVGACGASSLTPDPDLTPAPAPHGWSFVTWADPGLALAVPAGWVTGDPKATSVPDPSLSPQQKLNMEFSDEMASSGKTRLIAYGDVATSLESVSSGVVLVYVESGDSSLQSFADRSGDLDRKLVPGITIDPQQVVLPAGVAIRMAYSGKIESWPDFSEVDYLLRLPDGRSLTVAVSGADKAASLDTVATFAARVISTLKASP
jgi:hypothetical protein